MCSNLNLQNVGLKSGQRNWTPIHGVQTFIHTNETVPVI